MATPNSGELCERCEVQPSSSKLRVLILASEWGSSKGGLSTINRELAINLARNQNVQVTFFVPRCNDEDQREARDHNINLLKADELPGMDELNWLIFPPHDLPIDVVVGHGIKLGPQAQAIRKYRDCKCIHVVHTASEELGMHKRCSNPILSGEAKHETELELCRKADCVITVGPKLNEAFCCYLSSCKDKMLFNFTPGIFTEFTKVDQVRDRESKFQVLIYGRGDAKDFSLKGYDIAAEAVASLEDTHLVYVGASEEELEEVKSRFLECNIASNDLTVRSFLPNREKLKKLLCEVDLAIMPSRTEGFGLTGLEALSSGLPILVSRNSGFGKALNEVPFGSSSLIDSESPEMWAKAIRNVKSKSRKVRLQECEHLRASYDKTYRWDTQCEDLIRKMITMVHGSCLKWQRSTHQETSQQTDISTEQPPGEGTVPMEIRMKQVTFQKAHSGDPKVVMMEMVRSFLDTHADDIPPKEWPRTLRYYLEGALDLIERQASEGSLRILVECRTLAILERLWQEYCCGHLNAEAEKRLLTNDIKERFHVESVKLETTILKTDYLACRQFLLISSKTNRASTPSNEEMKLLDQTQVGDQTQTQTAEDVNSVTLSLAVNSRNSLSNIPNQTLVPKEQRQDTVSEELFDTGAGDTCAGGFPQYLQNITVIHDSTASGTGETTLRIAVDCGNLEILERLWCDYCSGYLNTVIEKCLLTDDIKRRFHVESVELQTTVLEEDYLACKEFLSTRIQRNDGSLETQENKTQSTSAEFRTGAVEGLLNQSDEETGSEAFEEFQAQSAEKMATQGGTETLIQSSETSTILPTEETQMSQSAEVTRTQAARETHDDIQSAEETRAMQDVLNPFAIALKVNTTVTNLDLRWNSIGDRGAEHLSEALKVNTTVTNLDLSKNVIGDRGAEHLSEALKVNTTVTNLGLRWNSIGDRGAEHRSEALKVNTTVTNLDLRGNSIGERGAEHLSDAAKVNITVSNLDFSENRDSGITRKDLESDTDVHDRDDFECPMRLKVTRKPFIPPIARKSKPSSGFLAGYKSYLKPALEECGSTVSSGSADSGTAERLVFQKKQEGNSSNARSLGSRWSLS